MGTIDVAASVERASRLQALMQRMQGLTPDRMKELEINLKAQTELDKTLNGGTAISAASASIDSQVRAGLERELQTVKQNLSLILGYIPPPTDVSEMQKIQTSMGSSFTSNMPTVARNINSMNGGINKLLAAIDSGIMTGVISLAQQAESATQQAVNQLTQQIPNPLQVVNVKMLSGAASQIQSLLNNPQALLNSLSSSITGTIDSTINNVANNILKEISTQNIQNSLPFVNTNITSSTDSSISGSVSTALTNPIPSGIPEGVNLDVAGPPINTPANEQKFDYTTYNEYGPVEPARTSHDDSSLIQYAQQPASQTTPQPNPPPEDKYTTIDLSNAGNF